MKKPTTTKATETTMMLAASTSASALSRKPVSRFSMTFKCGWQTPGEAVASRRGGQGVAAAFGQEWLPGAAANANTLDCHATHYRGRGYVRLASTRS